MKKIAILAIVVAAAGVLLYSMTSGGKGGAKLPSFTLKDPDGIAHSSSTIVKNGMILVSTAPILHDEKAQRGWSAILLRTMPKGKHEQLVFLENMSVSDWKSIARKDMRKDFVEGEQPLLLLDESGDVTRALGVGAEDTVVIVYSKKGRELYRFGGAPSEAEAQKMWGMLK